MKKSAFTLVELLVVIAIIAILMAILMPALRAARDQAKRIHCIANVKTLSLAWYMYQDENDGKLVGGHITGATWMWVLKPTGSTIAQKIDAIKKGALFPYVSKTVDVYRCPADRRQNDPRQYAFRSFSIAGGAAGESWGEYHRAFEYDEIKHPAGRYIFLEEIDPRGFNVGSWQMNVQSKRWVDPLAMWHNRASTLGFADGHAELRRWVDKSFTDWCEGAWEKPGSFKFNMTPPANEREDVDYMARGFPYKSLN